MVTEFQVSNSFLMKTYSDTGQPSLSSVFGASSKSSDDPVDPVWNFALVYLVEPRCASSAVLKFSGTLDMHNRLDKWSATIMAFSHFIIEDTACLYMFADIQGESFDTTLFHCAMMHSTECAVICYFKNLNGQIWDHINVCWTARHVYSENVRIVAELYIYIFVVAVP